MDDRKKYKEALERARELSQTITGARYEYIFPELKEVESEDERIRKVKLNEQNLSDKVETKFHVNEWVVTAINDVVQIKAVNNDHYTIDNGIEFNMAYVDRYWHKWTIYDAKDGDILFHSDSASNGIFIFRESLKYTVNEKVMCYCDYDSEDHFCLGENHTCCWTDAKILQPATKEQRNLLFAKMKEAGYEWDKDKKELTKIEQKFADKVEPKFEIGDVMRTLHEAAEGMTDGMPVIIAIDKDYYHCNNELIAIKDQDDYEYPPMNKRQKTEDKVIVTLIEKVKNEIINDTRNPYTAHGHEVLMELLAAYNYYQETERNGVNYIFNIENNDDVIRCMKGGMTSKEVCDLYTASQSTHTKYFYYGYNDNGARQISTMDELRTNIIAWLDEIVTCVAALLYK